MKIQLISDTHFEFMADYGLGFIEALDSKNIDVLVLAGDICKHNQIERILKLFCDKYKNVCYTTGNHEHYGSSIEGVNNILTRIKKRKIPNLHILNRDVVEIDGQRFVGCTLWFRDDPMNSHYVQHMADFLTIIGFARTVYEENRLNLNFLNKEVSPGDIVITHHLPSTKCIAPQFKNNELNRFFMCNCEELIMEEKPKAWLFGHTHSSIDTTLLDTRLVCNPFGYVGHELNENFKDKFIIEI